MWCVCYYDVFWFQGCLLCYVGEVFLDWDGQILVFCFGDEVVVYCYGEFYVVDFDFCVDLWFEWCVFFF